MIELPSGAPLKAYQDYIQALETQQGWLDVDLVHNCFLMGEEVGELFKSIRRYNRYFEEGQPETVQSERKTQVAEEIVDVLNYLLAIANRLDIDVEQAFRDKNAKNQTRTWS
jgi:NTP pyrophosphatase (non-canonical NTP hydrolase)